MHTGHRRSVPQIRACCVKSTTDQAIFHGYRIRGFFTRILSRSYTVLENRTAVDLELTAMRRQNVLRTFRLGTGREDWGVMSTEHYLRVVRTRSRRSLG